MASSLRILTCGNPEDGTDLSQILLHLGNTLDVFMGHLRKLSDADDNTHTFFGPFIGRSLLELSFTALIARLDPFRVLVLREMHAASRTLRWCARRQASIQWQGDVLAKEVPKKPLWGDKRFEEISRVLLADYFGHLFWNAALTRLLDQLNVFPGGVARGAVINRAFAFRGSHAGGSSDGIFSLIERHTSRIPDTAAANVRSCYCAFLAWRRTPYLRASGPCLSYDPALSLLPSA